MDKKLLNEELNKMKNLAGINEENELSDLPEDYPESLAVLQIANIGLEKITKSIADEQEAERKALEKARKIKQEKYDKYISGIAEKFKGDSTLEGLLKQLDSLPYDHKANQKAYKNNKERSKVVAKINKHVKSKLDSSELKFIKDINAKIRGGR